MEILLNKTTLPVVLALGIGAVAPAWSQTVNQVSQHDSARANAPSQRADGSTVMPLAVGQEASGELGAKLASIQNAYVMQAKAGEPYRLELRSGSEPVLVIASWVENGVAKAATNSDGGLSFSNEFPFTPRTDGPVTLILQNSRMKRPAAYALKVTVASGASAINKPRSDTERSMANTSALSAETLAQTSSPPAPEKVDAFPILSAYVGKVYFSTSDYRGYRLTLSSDGRQLTISRFTPERSYEVLALTQDPEKHIYTAFIEGKKRKAEILDGELTVYTGGGDKDVYTFNRDGESILVRRYYKNGILPSYTYWGGGSYAAVTNKQLASLGAQYGNFLAEQQRRAREADRERREQGAAFYAGLNSMAQAYSGAVAQQYSDQQASQAALSNLATQLQSQRSPQPQRSVAPAQSAAVATVATPNTSGSAPTRRFTQPDARPASPSPPAGAPSTKTDANRCVSSPELRSDDTSKGNTAAYVVNGCSEPVDVRICLKRDGAWNCGVRWGLQPQQRWSHSTFKYSGGIFVDARTSGSDKPLASP